MTLSVGLIGNTNTALWWKQITRSCILEVSVSYSMELLCKMSYSIEIPWNVFHGISMEYKTGTSKVQDRLKLFLNVTHRIYQVTQFLHRMKASKSVRYSPHHGEA